MVFVCGCTTLNILKSLDWMVVTCGYFFTVTMNMWRSDINLVLVLTFYLIRDRVCCCSLLHVPGTTEGLGLQTHATASSFTWVLGS